MTGPRRVSIRAPAKLNLGLEVVGRRADGYHDIVTVLQAVAIYDDLNLAPADQLRLTCDDPALTGASNLVFTALTTLRSQLALASGAAIRLRKGIPIAAGLGGASSDAAAALLAARRLWRAEIGDAALADLAANLGSDVPFFLHGGTALATGRGERITSLPPLTATWFVVVSPAIVIPRKTATLYSALGRCDFSDGERVRRLAARLAAGEPIAAEALPNPFARPLYALRPDLAALPLLMDRAGASVVALSGAGPAHFAFFTDPDQADHVAASLRTALGDAASVKVATPVPNPPMPVAT